MRARQAKRYVDFIFPHSSIIAVSMFLGYYSSDRQKG
jgi:hypothetical protein